MERRNWNENDEQWMNGRVLHENHVALEQFYTFQLEVQMEAEVLGPRPARTTGQVEIMTAYQ